MSPKYIVDSEGQVRRSNLSSLVSPGFSEKGSTNKGEQPKTGQSDDSSQPYSGEDLERALREALSGLRK